MSFLLKHSMNINFTWGLRAIKISWNWNCSEAWLDVLWCKCKKCQLSSKIATHNRVENNKKWGR